MRGHLKSLIVLSDLHVNSTVGLCPKGSYLDDGQPIVLSKIQEWLWDRWRQSEDIIQKEVKDNEVIVEFNGDICDIDEKDRNNQYHTDNPATVTRMALSATKNIVALADSIYVVRGTAAHVSSSASLEESFAEDLSLMGRPVIENPDTHSMSWWTVKLLIDNVAISFMHHPPSRGGARPANRNNVADRLAFDTFFAHSENGTRPPDLVVASHLHTHRDSYDHYKTRAIITPSWQTLTEYTYRLGLTDMADIGFIIINIDNDQYEVKKFLFTPEENQWQTYQSPVKKSSKTLPTDTTGKGLLTKMSSLLKKQ